MGHSISGFIAREDELTEITSGYKGTLIIPLTQGFAFLPMNDELYDELISNRDFLADICDERFLYLSSKIFQLGREFSLKTPVAYIETDYFGGDGFQRAVAWKDGEVRFGPCVAGNEEGVQTDKWYSDPINRALQEIEVRGYLMENEDEFPKDEFEELGLDKYRSNEDWIAAI
jgi:hypothetical protein